MNLRAKAAHTAVAAALEEGTLTRQACEVCGEEPRFRKDGYWHGHQTVVAHHDDYSKPLEVRWLCRRHHHAYHKSIGAYTNNGRRVNDPRWARSGS